MIAETDSVLGIAEEDAPKQIWVKIQVIGAAHSIQALPQAEES